MTLVVEPYANWNSFPLFIDYKLVVILSTSLKPPLMLHGAQVAGSTYLLTAKMHCYFDSFPVNRCPLLNRVLQDLGWELGKKKITGKCQQWFSQCGDPLVNRVNSFNKGF